ncbi:MAG: hypothetical protein HOC23_22215 [Halieaceae bacterium]|jgi:hypothetical protein|nr:hypothetical protein [Halieaceae bacterium]
MKKIFVAVCGVLFVATLSGVSLSQALTPKEVQTLMGLKASVYGELAYRQAQLSKVGQANPNLTFRVEATPPFLYINFIVPDERATALSREIGMPPGLSLSKIQLTEDGNSHYYITLNIYLASGVAAGYRAEWSTYVKQDNDPDATPRFMVVEARSSTPSGDPVNLYTDPSRVDYSVKNNLTKTHVDSDDETFFRASFTIPQQPFMEKITREWAESNDKIFWGNGVYDKAYYNATLVNSDMISIYNGEIAIEDTTRWSKYIDPTPDTVLLSTGPVELVVGLRENLTDGSLSHIEPDVLQAIISHKNQVFGGAVLQHAENVKKGTAEPFFEVSTDSDVPSLYINFRVPESRREAFAKAISLPPGFELARTRFIENTRQYGSNFHPLGHHRSKRPETMISLNIYHASGVAGGYRAEWATFVKRTDVDDDKSRYMILDVSSSTPLLDPVTALNNPKNPMKAPAKVFDYKVAADVANILIEDGAASFKAAIPLPAPSAAFMARPTLNWVEAKDYSYWVNGVCDKYYYNASFHNTAFTIVKPVPVTHNTRWSEFVEPVPFQVLFISKKSEFIKQPWNNLNELMERQ